MNQLQTFNFDTKKVRILFDNGEHWWCASDVCSILCYKNGPKAISDHCKTKGITKRYTLTNGGNQLLTYIDEPNLYRLIMHSKNKEAEKFQDWVSSEVLPQIRKTGSYSLQIPKTLPEALRAYAAELEQKEALQKQLKEQAPKVALADACLTAKNSQTITQTAKVLGIGRNILCEFLRHEKIFYRHRGENVPCQYFIDAGYFVVKERSIDHYDRFENHTQPLVTPKGLQFLERKIRETGGIKEIRKIISNSK
jgi:prophage antirepressor-like protein